MAVKKFLTSFVIFFLIATFFSKSSFAIYDPISVTNNKYGIHILFPEEISEAASLVNSTGGDWGYVTIPIKYSDRDLVKWQLFMDQCAKSHVIPIIRLATDGDYFTPASWEKPDKYSLVDFANFLNSLNWPTKNRYITVFNEPNRGDEWGGIPDPAEYADILNMAVDVFKQRSDKFFIISGGLDNAAPDQYQKFISQFNYMRQMNSAIPGIFTKIDGLSVHAYPNPAFSALPTALGPNKINSFTYEQEMVELLGGKALPVFITETGWTTNTISQKDQVSYYKKAFSDVWSDPNVVAVTPFIYHAEDGPFKQFSFILSNTKTDLYNGYFSLSKQKGNPQLEPLPKQTVLKESNRNTKSFKKAPIDIYNKINNQTKTFFHWLLNF